MPREDRTWLGRAFDAFTDEFPLIGLEVALVAVLALAAALAWLVF